MTAEAPARGAVAASRAGRAVFVPAVVVAVCSAAVLTTSGRWEGGIRFAVVTVVLLAARAVAPPLFAAAFAAFLLLATWASVEHWYVTLGQFDEAVHFLTPGSLAAVGYFALVRGRLLPDPDETAGLRRWVPMVWVTLVGVTGATVWEFYEWTVEQVAPDQMMAVGYTDTIMDLMAGTLGSLTAGALVLAWRRRAAATPHARR